MYARTSSSHGVGGNRAPPTSSRSSSRPSGRVELLGWINQVCGTHYPTIECLRDGLAYITLVEATVSRTEALMTGDDDKGDPNHHRTSLPRSSAARGLIDKADYSIALSGVTSSQASHPQSVVAPPALDPALDTIQTREKCERNFHLLQAMLRGCLVDKSHGMEVDVKRLASGKLQEHMRMLQWSVGFVEQQFALADKAAAKKQQQQQQQQQRDGALGQRSVGGGATNRQSRPLSRSNGNSGGDDGGAQRARSSTATTTRHYDANAALAQPTVVSDGSHQFQPKRTASASAAAVRRNSAAPQQKHQQSHEGSSYNPAAYALHEVSPSLSSSSSLPRSAAPKADGDVDAVLRQLLDETEALELDVWAQCSAGGGGARGQHKGGSKQPVANTLDDVSELVRERDVLWQALVAAEAAVWKSANEWRHVNGNHREQRDDGDDEVAQPSALLRDLSVLFDVSLTPLQMHMS